MVTGATDRRGSGYRVTDDLVLTAAHVLDDAEIVNVRFDADLETEWTVQTHAWHCLPGSDIALVEIRPPVGPGVAPVRYGRIGDRALGIVVQTVGFPRWKLRTDDWVPAGLGGHTGRFRDASHVIGSVATLANRREQTLEIVVPSAPAPDPDPGRSPWEGMSGAPLWVGDRVVGVVTKHYPGEGLQRLTATRLDSALDRLSDLDRAALADLLPFPDKSRLLVDVLPQKPWLLAASALKAQLADIAPDQLLGREKELEDVVRFCAGDDPYFWWQADPWAGKTALMSWVALHPPGGVDVVSFFVTSRLAGQADSNSFTSALIEQLGDLVEEDATALSEAGVRRGHLLRLLTAAADRSRSAGRRLLIVVDGLDEDTSSEAGTDLRSIASLLPRHPPPGVRVLVASRPHPPLPLDVPDDHPLKAVRPRELPASDQARNVESQAKEELRRLFRGSPLQRDVLALLTAAGGGLTRTDLEQLSAEPPYLLDDLLDGQLGRSVSSRQSPVPGPGGIAERVYLFGHEQLRELALGQFGRTITEHRNRIHDWADRYRENAWPADTPTYLLLAYTRLLTSCLDIRRLVWLATDRTRHACLLNRTGSDMLALEEVAGAVVLAADKDSFDLGALLRLAMVRDDLLERNRNVPLALPAAWAAAGQTVRAITLAKEMDDPRRRVAALCAVIRALATGGDRQGAVNLAAAAEDAISDIHYYADRDHALMDLASAVCVAGDYDLAERIVWDVADHAARAQAMNGLVFAMVAANRTDLAKESVVAAERTVAELTGQARDHALQGLAAAAAAVRDAGVALRTISRIREPRAVTQALRQLADSDEFDLAERCVGEIGDPDLRALALAELAVSAAHRRDQGRGREYLALAEAEVGAVRHPGDRARAQLAVDRARIVYADEREQEHLLWTARGTSTLAELALIASAKGDDRRADQLAAGLQDASRFDVFQVLAERAAAVGDHDRLLQVVSRVGGAESEARLLVHLTELPGCRIDRGTLLTAALQATERIQEGDKAAELRCKVAVALVISGRLADGVALAADVESAARRDARPAARDKSLVVLADVLSRADEHERAARLVLLIAEPAVREGAAAKLASAAGEAGELTVVDRMVAAIADRDRETLLVRLAEGLASHGYNTSAEHLLEQIHTPSVQAELVGRLVQHAAVRGDFARTRGYLDRVASDHQRVGILRELMGATTTAAAVAEVLEIVEHSVMQIEAPELRIEALSAAAGLDGPDQNRLLLDRAEEIWSKISDKRTRRRSAQSLVDGALTAADLRRAERLLGELSEDQRDQTTGRLVLATVTAGDDYHALELEGCIRDVGHRTTVLSELAEALSEQSPGRLDAHILSWTNAIGAETDQNSPDVTAARMAIFSAAAGDFDKARFAENSIADEEHRRHVRNAVDRLVHRAEIQRRPVPAPSGQSAGDDVARSDPPLSDLVRAAADRGDHQRAERLANGLTGSERPVALRWLADLAISRADFGRAVRLARLLDARRRQEVFTGLVLAAIGTGDYGRVDRLVAEMGDSGALSRALTVVAVAAATPPRTAAPSAPAEAAPATPVLLTVIRGLKARLAAAAGVETLIADVVGTAAWRTSLDAIGQIAMPVLLGLCDELTAGATPG